MNTQDFDNELFEICKNLPVSEIKRITEKFQAVMLAVKINNDNEFLQEAKSEIIKEFPYLKEFMLKIVGFQL